MEIGELSNSKTTLEWDIADWDKYFHDLPSYEGNKFRSAQLIVQLVDGVKWVRDNQTDVKNFITPAIHVDNKKGILSEGGDLAHFSPQTNDVHVSLSGLEKLSWHPPKDRRIVFDKNYTTAWSGVVDDEYFFRGVQEADHSRYIQNGGQPIFFDSNGVQAVYDSQEHEFEALLAQKQAAQAKNEPSLVKLFERRIIAAQKIRAKSSVGREIGI